MDGEASELPPEQHEQTVVGAVALLHAPDLLGACTHCSELAGRSVRWPCPTMVAVGAAGETQRPLLTVRRVMFATVGTPLPAGVDAVLHEAFSERMPDFDPPDLMTDAYRMQTRFEVRPWRCSVVVDAVSGLGIPVRLVLPSMELHLRDHFSDRVQWFTYQSFAEKAHAAGRFWVPPVFS